MSEQPTVGLPSNTSGEPPMRDDPQTVAPPTDDTGSPGAGVPVMPELSIGPAGPSSASNSTTEPPKLDGYVVHAAVGEGGMGTVWRGVQLSTRRNVALKLISAAGFGSERARLRFDREVEITARLEHPNIARVYDSGINRGVYFFAMELIDGVPLDQFAARQKLSREQVLRLFVTICRGVHHAHTKGVIHRDLKPGNILVSVDGVPHVLDFGLAKALLQAGKEAGISIDGEVAGTPGYMAPEQAAGKSDLDSRCDVYSLGVILYRLLTGQTPHDLSGTYLDVLRRISEEEPKRPRLADSTMDSDLEAILLHAIERDPRNRYADAGDLARDVENYLNGDPVSATPPSVTYFLRKRMVKHRVKLVTLLIVIVLVSAAGTLTWRLIQSHRDAIKKRIETQRLQDASDGAKAVANGDARLSERKWQASRDQYNIGMESLARGGVSSLPAELGLWDVDRQSPLPLITIANPANASVGSSCLIFLPDSRRVLAGYDDGTLRLLDAATGRELRKITAHSSAVRSVAVGGNGLLALSGTDRGALRLWDLNTGEMKRELPDAADTSYKLKRLALSGDGNFAIVARGPPADALESKPRNDVLTLFAAKDGKVLLTTDVANGVLDATGSTTQISFSPDSKRVMAAGANVAVWNVADGKKTASIKSSATAVAFSDDGKWIVAGTSSGAAYALQLDTPQATAKTFQGSGDLILAVGYDARSGHVIEGLEDGSLRIVDGGDVERWVHPAPSSNNAVNAIAFSPNLRTAVVAGDDGLTAWHLGTSSEDITLASAGPFTDASISSDGRLALVRSENRRASLAGARLFDTATGHSLTPAGFPTGRSSAAVLSRNGKTIAAVIDYELVIWSLDPAQELRRISLRMPAISDPPAIAITSDGSTVALSGRANTLLVYRAMGTSEPAKLTGHSGRITSIAFSESGHEVLTGSEDMTARAWNVDTGASIATLFGHAAPINSVALSMDGTVAITASGELTATDNSVRVWTLPSGRQLMTLDIGKNSAPLRSVAISGDGRLIAAGDNRDSSATVMIWTRADGMPLRTILTRRGIARALSFDQSGQYLLSGADSAEVWNFGWAKQGAELKKDLDTAPVGKATNLATLARWYNYAAEPDWALSLNEGAPSLTPLESARCEWIAGHLELALEKLNSVGAQEAPSYYVKLCAEAIRAERSAK